MVAHNEIQTGSSIVVMGSVGIIAATFLLGNDFLKDIAWYLDPITHFMIGGLLLIISGCSLLIYFKDRDRKNALKTYDVTFFLGLSLIIIAGFQSIVRYLFYVT